MVHSYRIPPKNVHGLEITDVFNMFVDDHYLLLIFFLINFKKNEDMKKIYRILVCQNEGF